MEMSSGDWLGRNRSDDELYRSLTGDSAGPDHQLRPVFSPDVGHQAGIGGCGVVEHCFTGVGF